MFFRTSKRTRFIKKKSAKTIATKMYAADTPIRPSTIVYVLLHATNADAIASFAEP